jgi:hypothetical protein
MFEASVKIIISVPHRHIYYLEILYLIALYKIWNYEILLNYHFQVDTVETIQLNKQKAML